MYANTQVREYFTKLHGLPAAHSMVHTILTQAELDELLSANSPASMIRVRVNDRLNTLELSLTKIVATSNYKTLAKLGRYVGCQFQAGVKMTSIALRDKAGFTVPGNLYGRGEALRCDDKGSVRETEWDAAVLVLALPSEEKETLMKLVRRLSGTRAKRYSSTQEAAAAREVNAERTREAMRRSWDGQMSADMAAAIEWADDNDLMFPTLPPGYRRSRG